MIFSGDWATQFTLAYQNGLSYYFDERDIPKRIDSGKWFFSLKFIGKETTCDVLLNEKNTNENFAEYWRMKITCFIIQSAPSKSKVSLVAIDNSVNLRLDVDCCGK